jgi:hypothetical protein
MDCKYCLNKFKTESSLSYHIKNAKYCIETRSEKQNLTYKCGKCNKILTSKQRKTYHENICNSSLVEDNNKIELRLLKKRLEDKDDIIKELKEINKEKEKDVITSKIVDNIINSNKVIKPISKKSLVLNDISIIARAEDGFINATELCKAGGKEFKHWKENKNNQSYLQVLSSSVGIPTDELINYETGSNEKRGTWVHPQVAINISQWISPQFDVQVSKWVFELALTGSVELGNEKSNSELDAIYNDKLNNLNKELEFKTNKLKKYETTIFNRTTDICPIEYYSKDVVYFFKFETPLHLRSKYVSEYPNIDNREYICIEFGVSSNFEQRIKAHKSDKTKDSLLLLHVIEMDKRYTASKMESYIKTIAKQMNIKFDYEKKLECILVNEEEFNILINKINTGLNTLEDYDTEIKETDINDIKEPCLINSIEIELRKLDIQVEMKKIEVEADKINKKIESVTDLFKNKIISFTEYKEMITSF